MFSVIYAPACLQPPERTMNKIWIVDLDDEERTQLREMTSAGTHKSRRIRRANTLLMADSGSTDETIAETLGCGISTVCRTRKRFVEEGLEAALTERRRTGADRKLDQNNLATLYALACTDPPQGRRRWTLQLLADQLIALTDVDDLSTSTVSRRLEESDLKPWQRKMWCIPAIDALFVARMEHILDLYTAKPDEDEPVVCFDEVHKQLISETRTPITARPGRRERYDYEYRRNGKANLFVFFDRDRCWRHIKATSTRTAVDFAECMRELIDEHYPNASVVHVVMDNLNTHTEASLYKAFPPAEARRILRRLRFHFTPKHASWLNMVEIENSALTTQCLARRIPDFETLAAETTAWADDRNDQGVTVNWSFDVTRAREKMANAYPTNQSKPLQ